MEVIYGILHTESTNPKPRTMFRGGTWRQPADEPGHRGDGSGSIVLPHEVWDDKTLR